MAAYARSGEWCKPAASPGNIVLPVIYPSH
jgi:hypothetical protein